MGLSSKQVLGDGIDWGQTLMQTKTLELPKPPAMRRLQQQQSEPLKCPRCDSPNTKFCYYNNYNKLQPRHFCKSCKRHWTKGGTLRNVPVGGGRKNKRLKTSNTTAATSSSTTTAAATAANMDISQRWNTQMAIQTQQQRQSLPFALADKKSISDILYRAMIRPPYSLQHDSMVNSSRNNFISNNNGIFLGSTPSLSQDQNLHFPFSSSSSSFDSNPSSVSTSIQSSNVYNYIRKSEAMEDSTITRLIPAASSTITPPWHVPATSGVMDMTSNWSWDDINTFVSTDLNLPWDDFEIKP